MRILVTGSAGFIGYHVARRLLADGHAVAGVDSMVPYYDVALKEARAALLRGEAGFTEHRTDIAEADAFAAVFEASRPEVVVHLAAQAGVRYSLEHPESYIRANVVGTFNLLELCRRHPVRHLLIASTSSAYGASTEMPFTETQRADAPLTIYAATKRATELMAHSTAHLWGQPITAFRFFTVYGPWGRPDMAPYKFTKAAFAGVPIEIYGDGTATRDFTYVDDVAEAVVRLIAAVPERGRPVSDRDSLSPVAPYRLVNIGRGTPMVLTDFIAAIERAVGRPIARRLTAPQQGDAPDTWADASLLEALTGYRPDTPVEEGVARLVAWYRDHHGA